MSDEGKRMQDFLERMVKDSDFAKRVKEDKNVLTEMGWVPEAVSGFQVKRSDKSTEKDDYWGCGTDCGCISSVGKGGNCVCGGGSGSG